jgi:hypothetical protein
VEVTQLTTPVYRSCLPREMTGLTSVTRRKRIPGRSRRDRAAAARMAGHMRRCSRCFTAYPLFPVRHRVIIVASLPAGGYRADGRGGTFPAHTGQAGGVMSR